MKKVKQINRQRSNRTFRVSNAVKRYSTRYRLCVFRSNTNIYAQIIDDEASKTLVSSSTRDKELRGQLKNASTCDAAQKVGETLAKKAVALGILQVAFDRHGFKYHGRVKALADAARTAGLDIGSAGDPAKKEKSEKPSKQKASKADKVNAKAAQGKASSKKSK